MKVAERSDGPTGPSVKPSLSDGEALVGAYRAYRAPLVRYAHRLTGDAATAHDVVQDVFVKLWETREGLTIRSSFQALLYTMTRNRALNHNRHRAHVAADVDAEEALGTTAAETAPASDAALQADELRRHLHRWIEALPPRRAEAFTLSRFHALSHGEIAEIMGLSIRTVDTHIVHALRDLRIRLDALYGEPVTPPSEP
jgi:RNA polymerase sigma-70 factor (ECF subfamily)